MSSILGDANSAITLTVYAYMVPASRIGRPQAMDEILPSHRRRRALSRSGVRGEAGQGDVRPYTQP